MANLIQATVYQIDGAPQQPSPITLDFRTGEVVIKEATIPTIASVQSAILYYNVPNNPQSVQTFYVSEDIATLVGAANNAGTSQTQVTVLTINQDPQVPGGIQYSFPSNEILVGEFTDASIGVQAYVQYKNVKYYTQENEAAILAASNNTGVAAGTNPTSLFIPYNNAGIFGDSFLENDVANDILKTVYSASDIGLKLDFANDVYVLGDYNGVSNNTYINVDNASAFISLLCSGYGVYQQFDGINGNIEIASTNIIKSTSNGNDIGLKLDFANDKYWIGDVNGSTNNVAFTIDGGGNEVYSTSVVGGYDGLWLDYTNRKFTFGDANNNVNNTYIIVDDTNQRLEVSGNLASGTAGASSGQFLKIRIGGVDYKIALLNN